MKFLLGHSVTYQHTIPNMLNKSPLDFSMTISRKTYGKRLLDSLTSIHISTLNLWPVILWLELMTG